MRAKRKISLLLVGIVFLLLSEKALAVDFGDVIINEVMWMGTKASANDEWIELFNLTNNEINLSKWILFAEDEIPQIILHGSIVPGGFFLLERTDDQTISNIFADQIYTGDLGNGGEHLFLKNDQGQIVDEIDASLGWPAGSNNELKASMARQGDGSWLTSDVGQGKDANGNDINGTPREVNKFLPTPTPSLMPTATILPSPPHLTSGLTPTVITTAVPTVTKPTPTFALTLAPAKATYQINEVKNEKGEVLSSVKIYVDDQYIHHYAPEVLEFCNSCYCDDDKKVACGFGEHVIRLEKNGYQDWEETKVVKAGDSYPVNPVMKLLLSPTSTHKAVPVSSLSPTGRISPSPSLAITSLLLSPTSSPLLPFADFALAPKKITSEEEILEENSGQVLGEEKKEKKNSGWYFGIGAFYLGASGWRLARKDDNDIMEKLNFEKK
ncbi:lamin tail domain-containing protein [Candidatus Shapirobacteria bacterium]|nr:lamin tail domain-containing protein [Candidatus Shapirobacteria bacterium]